MKLFPFALIIFLSGCIAKPKQPPLTDTERSIIREIMLITSADTIFRELYPSSKDVILKAGELRYYSLTIHVSCEKLKQKDSLKSQASLIANNLRSNLLNNYFEFSFNHSWDKIYIDFLCSPAKGYEVSESFEFDK